jgi:hypothetical protein
MHGRVLPIIGDCRRDGIPRSAVRAVDEGIKVSPVMYIVQFLKTVVADGYIRGEEGKTAGIGALRYRKVGKGAGFSRGNVDACDLCKGRSLSSDPIDEQDKIFAFGIDDNTFRGIGDRPPDMHLMGKVVDKGPETNTLDNPLYRKSKTFFLFRHTC